VPIRLQQNLSRFRRDKRGNVAIIFAIAAIPLISAIGCAVDYSMATRMKAKLQSAADAASIAALSQKVTGLPCGFGHDRQRHGPTRRYRRDERL
jgi:Flp pilus assembly protein TadG